MRNKTISALLLSMMIGVSAQAQLLLGQVFRGGGTGVDFAALDPITGTVQTLAPSPTSFVLGPRTVDPIHGRFMFLDASVNLITPNLGVFDVNAHTYSTVSTPYQYSVMEYDPTLDAVIAVLSTPPNAVGSIDLQTGVFTPITATNLGPTGGSAFDPASRRLFYMAGSYLARRLVTVDLNAHTTQSVPVVDDVREIAYDSTSGRIITVPNQVGGSTSVVLSIDAATGASEFVLAFTGTNSFDDRGIIAFDSARRVLYFRTSTPALVKVYLDTKQVAYVNAQRTVYNLVPYPGSASVPAMSPALLAALTAVLAIAALISLRRLP